MRSIWGTFPEYHTSADNLDFIKPQSLAAALRLCTATVEVLENNGTYVNQNPYCEPQLGKRNLYQSMGGKVIGAEINACLWVLNLSDGENSLLDIAERSGVAFSEIHQAAVLLHETGLLVEAAGYSRGLVTQL